MVRFSSACPKGLTILILAIYFGSYSAIYFSLQAQATSRPLLPHPPTIPGPHGCRQMMTEVGVETQEGECRSRRGSTRRRTRKS